MNRLTLCAALIAALGVGMGTSLAHAETFMYHGSLQDAGKAANGAYDLQLTLYSDQKGGHAMAAPVTLYGVKVKNGNFVTQVDFGQTAALASQGWVEVQVKAAGAAGFVALDQRSPVAPEGTCPGSWALDGNAGNPPGSYLGTADAQPLDFYVNGLIGGAFTDRSPLYPLFSTYGATSLSDSDGAIGVNSTAVGYHGKATFDGSFDYSPQSGTISSVLDTATNQFIVNAPHGVGINTATAPDGTPLRDELTIAVSPDLPASNADLTFETGTATGGSYNGFNFNAEPNGFFQLAGLYNNSGLAYDSLMYIDYRTPNGSRWGFNGAGSVAGHAFTVGVDATGGNGAFLSSAGVWTNASSRTFKEAIASIDSMAVLEKLVSMPVKTWFYKGNHEDGQHMGPIAEDFAQTFGLGSNEKYIGTVDESGVALAAIQGLNRKVEDENATLKQQNADLRSELGTLASRLDRLEHAKGE